MKMSAKNARGCVEAILFDLDGTLTDSFEGITRSIQYAVTSLGAREPTRAELKAYIGPPLRGTFALLLGTEDAQVIERALTLYRERFSVIGLFENEVYADVPRLLAALRAHQYRLYLATSKRRVYAERILAHFSLAHHFARIYGTEFDGRYENKAELIMHILRQEHLVPETTLMIGDRSHDIIAAKQNGMRSIGVTYGYGTNEELVQADPDHICGSPADIVVFFCGPSPHKPDGDAS